MSAKRLRGGKAGLVLPVLAVVERVLDVGPELTEHVPGPSCRQGRAAAQQGMPGVGAAFRVPLVGYEGGSIGARKSREGGNCFAAVRACHHVMNRGIAEAPPESRFVRVTESWILVVKRGD